MTVASTTNRVDYTGNGSTTVFSFTFRIFSNSDLVVTKADAAGIETTLVLDTDYTVTGAGSYSGGSITLGTALTSGHALTIQRVLDITQETDLRNQGQFFAETHEDVFDRMVMIGQQLQEQIDRSAKLPVTNTSDAEELVADIVLLADNIANLDTIADAISDIQTVANDLNEGTSEINTVAVNIANVNAVGTDIDNVNAVAGDLTNIDAVAANETNIDAVAGNATNINAVNANKTNIDAVAGNATNINAVNANKTNIDTVAGNNANVSTVAGISANVTTVAGIAANVTSVAGNATNINAVAGNATNINAVNANKTNIDAVAGNATNVNTVATNISAVNTASTNIAAIIDAPNQASSAAASAAAAAASAASGMYSAVQDKSADYTVVAGDAGDLIRVTTTGGARTITLPEISSVSDGFKVAIVKWTGDSNAVTIARSGSDTINGATSATIGSQYTQTTFVADFETNQWFAATSGLGSTNVAVDVFSGNGSTVAFTLSGDAGTKNNTLVTIGGVYQAKSTYSLSGTTLTFSSAPPSGSSNIEVVWTAPLPVGTPSDDTVSTAKLQAGAVTYAKMQNVTAGKLLGRDTSGAGVVQELPIAVNSSGQVGVNTSSFDANWGPMLQVTNAASDGSGGIVIESYKPNLIFKDISGGSPVRRHIYADGGVQYFGRGDASITNDAQIDASGNFGFNSGYGSVATAYGCRAWVNFNGTGTVAIRASANVSSITDLGTGDYQVNFTTAMPDANYAKVIANAQNAGFTPQTYYVDYTRTTNNYVAPTTTSFSMAHMRASDAGSVDTAHINVAVFR